MAGSSARDIIAPVNGYRGALARSGKHVKDHAKENRRKLREIANNNINKQNAVGQKENLSKMKQFKGVKSRVFESRDDNAGADRNVEQEGDHTIVNKAFDDSLPERGEVFSPKKQVRCCALFVVSIIAFSIASLFL